MRVLFLTHSYPRYAGDPAGSFLLQLAQALAAQDVAVHVLAPAAKDLPSSEQIDGIPVTRFRYAPQKYETLAYTGTMVESVSSAWSARLAMCGLFGAAFIAAIKAQRTFRPDIIHAHWWLPNGCIAAGVAMITKVPLVTTMHGTDIRMLESIPILRPIARSVLNHSSATTTVSHWLAQRAQAIGARTTFQVAPMPAAVNLFMPGGSRAANRILFVGRLNAQKGIEYALRAIAIMPTAVKFDVVGTGPASSSYQELAKTLRIADRVSFWGEVSRPELASFYRQATALVVPSVEEGLGLVAVEAQLCETPVVAFSSGGITDVIEHERTGLLVPVRDVEALASALQELVSNPALAAKLGCAGRETAIATFAPSPVARRYATIYRKALHPRAA